MLCPSCHVHTTRGFPYCLRCGRALPGARAAAIPPCELHPLDAPGTAFALSRPVTAIGRNEDDDLVVDDPRVSRYHARVWRDETGYGLEDLDSLNGTWVNDAVLRAGTRRLDDGDVVRVGHRSLRFEQPRGLDVAGRTELGVAGTMLGTALGPALEGSGMHAGHPDALTPTSMESRRPGQATSALERRPRRRSGWALKRLAAQGDEVRFVLRNTRTGQYVQLTDRDRFLWDLLDGENTVRDLLFAYSRRYGQLALARIEQLLAQLGAAGLLVGTATPAPEPSLGKRVRTGVIRALMRMEVSIGGIDGVVARLYRAGAWRLFTRTGLFVIWALVIGGIAGFVVAAGHQTLFDVTGAGVLGVVAAAVGYIGALTIHELAHAVAVKSYGRSVKRGGVMIMMAMPFAFVDTSDMWLEARRPRIVVSLAGPVATAAVGGAFAIAAATVPGTAWPGIFYQVAFGLYLNTLFNFNPLIPLDGYLVLSDLLDMPRLREEAGAYFRKGLWGDLRAGVGVRRLRWGLAFYGVLSVVATVGFMFMGLFMWRTRLSGIVHAHVAAPFDTVVIVAGLMLVLFPIWFAPCMKIRRMVTARRRPEQGVVEVEAGSLVEAPA